MREQQQRLTPSITSCRRALDAAVPGQDWAKHALEVEAALIPCAPRHSTRRPALRPHPVLLLGNNPGSLPAKLGSTLARHYDLPFQEVNAEFGFSVETTLANLLRQRNEIGPGQVAGVVVVTGLERLDPAHASRFAGAIASTQIIPTAHRSSTVELSAADVFWIGGVAVPEPLRVTPLGEAVSFVAVGNGVTEVVAARIGAPEIDFMQSLMCSLEPAFKKASWLLPYDRHDLLAQLQGPASPLKQFCSWCEGLGVEALVEPAAFEAFVDLALCRGGAIDDLEIVIREAFEPVFPLISDPSSRVARVVIGRDAALGEAFPIVEEGPRTTVVAEAGPIRDPLFPDGLPLRPSRTSQSNPEIRLARASDLARILKNQNYEETPR
jgi:hypothetical protein